jgi:D-glycero-D-manno-heptose 1,7-bisphosphate phosphatase
VICDRETAAVTDASPLTKRQKAAFLDRDGVINIESGYVHAREDFSFIAGSVRALRLLRDAGYLLVVVSNQSGIARGMYTEDDYHALTSYIQDTLAAEGVTLDSVQYCPHLPDAPVARYRRDCYCRKPRPGMLQRAITALNIDVTASFLVGDRLTDIQAGRTAGVGHCYLVRSGQPLTAEAIRVADAVFDDLQRCAEGVLASAPSGYTS